VGTALVVVDVQLGVRSEQDAEPAALRHLGPFDAISSKLDTYTHPQPLSSLLESGLAALKDFADLFTNLRVLQAAA
jgi:hypothetical protein